MYQLSRRKGQQLLFSLFVFLFIQQVTAQGCWQSVSAGFDHTVAIKMDGTLWAWGSNVNRQLGNGTAVSESQPKQISTATNWKAISAGYSFTVALKTDGSLWTWGRNLFSSLGNAQAADIPTRVGTSNNWKAISAGRFHALALQTDGSLWAWGYNANGQVGNQTTTDQNTPVRIGTANDWASISAGYQVSTAIKTDGSLWYWGLNTVGNPFTGIGPLPQVTIPTRIGTANNWQSVSAGVFHIAAIQTDGSLWTLGGNVQGGLGDGTNIGKTTFVRVGTANDWQSVQAGLDNTMAIKTTGTLWGWGYNAYGQLGDGSLANKNVPTQIGTAANWQSVKLGPFHSVAINAANGLFATGNNASGELGIGSNTNQTAFTPLSCPTTQPPSSSIANVFVYADNNANTHFDAGDAAMSGIIVTLLNESNQVIATTVTATNGSYAFNNLSDGSYSLQFPQTLPNGKSVVTPNPMAVSLGISQTYDKADARYYKTASIQGVYVFADNNKNGKYDAGDTPIAGVPVILTNTATLVDLLTVSAANGSFSFLNLLGGEYKISFPYALADGKDITIPNPFLITLTQGQVFNAADAPYVLGNANINNAFVFTDNNNDKKYNAGDSPLSNVTVTLKDAANQVAASTNTATNGSYSFIGVKPGSYTLNFPAILPDGSTITTLNPIPVTLTAGQNFSGGGAAYIKNKASIANVFVFADKNLDGKYNAGDSPISGVTVTLTNSNNQVVATTTSAVDGSYAFLGLALGTYTVSFPPTLANGMVLSTSNSITAILTAIGQVFNAADAAYRIPALASQSRTFVELNAVAEPNRAHLQWVNNTGNLNDFFTVEKQNNVTGDFDKILTVNSKTTETNEIYTAFDDQITEGDNTYRVALTLLDGTVKTSALKTLMFKNRNDIRVFPNPASDFVAVDLKQYEGRNVTIYLYNSFGTLVKAQFIEKATATPVQLNLDEKFNGYMLLRVAAEGRREVIKRFVLQK